MKDERKEQFEAQYKSLLHRTKAILALIGVLVLAGVTVCELVNEYIAPDFPAHLITIVFTACIAVSSAWFISRKYESLLLQIIDENIERKQAEEQIATSLNENEILLKEIHHRVKNNLQVVSSMLQLQSKYIKDEHAISAFKESQNRIETMALIHENLYQARNLSRINFAVYTKELITNLFLSHGVNPELIESKINVSEIFFDVNTAMVCSLILNELVSNSLKHAFPEGRRGEISIALQPNNRGKIILTVSDNGIGFPEDSSPGNSESLGLKLVTSLVKQLGGSMVTERGGGTIYRITFVESKGKESAQTNGR